MPGLEVLSPEEQRCLMSASHLLETDRAEGDIKELLSNREIQCHSVSYSVLQIGNHIEKLLPMLMDYHKTPTSQPTNQSKRTRIPAMGRL